MLETFMIFSREKRKKMPEMCSNFLLVKISAYLRNSQENLLRIISFEGKKILYFEVDYSKKIVVITNINDDLTPNGQKFHIFKIIFELNF